MRVVWEHFSAAASQGAACSMPLTHSLHASWSAVTFLLQAWDAWRVRGNRVSRVSRLNLSIHEVGCTWLGLRLRLCGCAADCPPCPGLRCARCLEHSLHASHLDCFSKARCAESGHRKTLHEC
jgi:hypothetical protein